MTAVEWFFRWVNDNPEATHKEYSEAFEQAKKMEKEQIMKSYYDGQGFPANRTQQINYYNETYREQLKSK